MDCPALSALAQGGVTHSNAFCASPTCSPSRAALLTGRYPSDNGMRGLAHLGFRLDDYGQHLAHLLRPAGYRSYLAGFQHVANPPAATGAVDIGYDAILNESGDFEPATRATVGFLETQAPGGEPFFLDVGYFAPHRPFPSLDGIDVPDGALACFPHLCDTPPHRGDVRRFVASLLSFDRCCGHVLSALDASGLADNTLVLATTDHGPAFPRQKGTLYDGGLGVFLVLRLPGTFDGGHHVDHPVHHLDVVPTILELAGVPVPAGLPGAPLQRDQTPRPLFFETNWHAAFEPARAVRTPRWKYIRNYALPRPRIAPNIDDSPSKALLYRTGQLVAPLPPEELYDLAADPSETVNLAADPAHASTRGRMAALLDDWMQDRGDWLLDPHAPPPAGATLAPWDAYSPLGDPGHIPPEVQETELPPW